MTSARGALGRDHGEIESSPAAEDGERRALPDPLGAQQTMQVVDPADPGAVECHDEIPRLEAGARRRPVALDRFDAHGALALKRVMAHEPPPERHVGAGEAQVATAHLGRRAAAA